MFLFFKIAQGALVILLLTNHLVTLLMVDMLKSAEIDAFLLSSLFSGFLFLSFDPRSLFSLALLNGFVLFLDLLSGFLNALLCQVALMLLFLLEVLDH